MSSREEQASKLREERMAREKARIQKLRELNLKKYSRKESPVRNIAKVTNNSTVKNHFFMNGALKKSSSPSLSQISDKSSKDLSKSKLKATNAINKVVSQPKIKVNNADNVAKSAIDPKVGEKSANGKHDDKLGQQTFKDNNPTVSKFDEVHKPKTSKADGVLPFKYNSRKTIAFTKSSIPKLSAVSGKSVSPRSNVKQNTSRQSVFERLYKPKVTTTQTVNEVDKLRNDPKYLQKVMNNVSLILNKRHSTGVFLKSNSQPPVRRSISAVHFKRISKAELSNCVRKSSSIGEKLNKVHLGSINEDESVKQDKVVSAVKSERKKVTFTTPGLSSFNTPKPEELQTRLMNWLQKRGKSLDSYQHLQCFGIQHLSLKRIKPLNMEEAVQCDAMPYSDENKENIALESDSDNNSYAENMNDRANDFLDCPKANADKWRRASYVSDYEEVDDSHNTTLTSGDTHNIDELLLGALDDLTELLREGFDWEQCAQWLRAVRERFPTAPNTAAYWECRAALEERRGDLSTSMQCWGEAVVKGTERSVVESNLDHLLDKFMQLKISPNSGKKQEPNPKMVDIKNVFKSTIVGFAMRQARLRNPIQQDSVKYMLTPVRRSARLSAHWSDKRTSQVYSSVKKASEFGREVVFVPNDKLFDTP